MSPRSTPIPREPVPTVHFTSQLERFTDAPSVTVEGETLQDVLASVFADYPKLRGYILDEQGAVRRHVAIFIDGAQAQDRERLTDPVKETDEVHVFQALSGG